MGGFVIGIKYNVVECGFCLNDSELKKIINRKVYNIMKLLEMMCND